MRTNTKFLLLALLQIKVSCCFLWKLPIIYELHKRTGQETHQFSICEKKNNVETDARSKKILIFLPELEPIDWECGEISWDLDADDNTTSIVNPKTEQYKSPALEPFNIAFLFI